MNKKVKFLAALVAAMSLASCGDTTSNGGTITGGSITDPWWETEGNLTFDEDGKVVFNETIDIALRTVVAGEDEAALRNIVDEFNSEYSGQIRVTVTSTNQSTYEGTVANLIKNGTNAPDLLMSHQKAHKWFADTKYVQPFDEAIEASGIEFDKNNYVYNLSKLSNLGYDNAQFQIPIDAQSMVILYNKKMLEELEVSLPQTNEDLMAVCQAFAAKYTDSSYKALSVPMSEDFFYNYVYNTALVQNGFKFYDETTLKASWTDAANLKAVNSATDALNALFNGGYMDKNESGDVTQARFIDGETLFLFCLPWNVNSIVKAFADNRSLNISTAMDQYVGAHSMAGIFATNEDSETPNAIFGDSHSFLMSKTVTDINKKVACLIFSKWFTENSSAGTSWAKAGHVSASSTITNSDEYSNDSFVSNFINRFYLDTNDFQTIGNTKFYSDVIRYINSAATKIVSGSNIESTLKNEQNMLNGAIDSASWTA